MLCRVVRTLGVGMRDFEVEIMDTLGMGSLRNRICCARVVRR